MYTLNVENENKTKRYCCNQNNIHIAEASRPNPRLLTLSLLSLAPARSSGLKLNDCCVKESHVRIIFNHNNINDMTNSIIKILAVGAQLIESQTTLHLLPCTYSVYSHYSQPITLNKQWPWTVVWAILPAQMSITSVQLVWRESVKQLCATLLKSFKQGKSSQHPCIKIWHVNKLWIQVWRNDCMYLFSPSIGWTSASAEACKQDYLVSVLSPVNHKGLHQG